MDELSYSEVKLYSITYYIVKKYKIRSIGRLGITFEPSPELTACFLKSGIMNAQSPPKLEGDIKNQIFKIYKSLLVGGLGFSTRMVPDENE